MQAKHEIYLGHCHYFVIGKGSVLPSKLEVMVKHCNNYNYPIPALAFLRV